MNNKGYIALISVMTVSAVVLSITLSLLIFGANESRVRAINQEYYQSRALANACVEEALQQLREDETATIDGQLTLTTGDCEYEVIDNGSPDFTIQASGLKDTISKIEVTTDEIAPIINTSSWQDVQDF